MEKSLLFYEKTLAPLGYRLRVDYNGADGPPGHPDLKGLGKNGRMTFWLREGRVDGDGFHIGFVASSKDEVRAAYEAAMKHGARDNGAPAIRPYYDPRYYAANVLDPDGHSIEFVYKNWQHPQS